MDDRRAEVRGQQKQSKDPGNNQHNPQHANYWAPLTSKRHIPPHPAQPRHTNDGAPRTRKRHQREHRPQRPTERSDPTQHAKGRTGDCPGPRKETATRRTVTQGEGGVPPPSTPSRGPLEWRCLRRAAPAYGAALQRGSLFCNGVALGLWSRDSGRIPEFEFEARIRFEFAKFS